MPISPAHKIWPVMSIFQNFSHVDSVVDIGAGFGKYGVLLREHLDVRLKRYRKTDWRTIIDCIEIWPDYISDLHRYIYDCVYIGDAVKISRRMPRYDVAIVSEVLEHIPKNRGEALLDNLYKKCNLGISITFPPTFKENSGKDWPNPYERHRCLWTPEEVSSKFTNVNKIGRGQAVHILK